MLRTADKRLIEKLGSLVDPSASACNFISTEFDRVRRSVIYRFTHNCPIVLAVALFLESRKELLVFRKGNANFGGLQDCSYLLLTSLALNDQPLLDFFANNLPSVATPRWRDDFNAYLYSCLRPAISGRSLNCLPLISEYSNSSPSDKIGLRLLSILAAIQENDPYAFNAQMQNYGTTCRAKRSNPPDAKILMLPLHGCYMLAKKLGSNAISTWDVESPLPWDAGLHRLIKDVTHPKLLFKHFDLEHDCNSLAELSTYERLLQDKGILLV